MNEERDEQQVAPRELPGNKLRAQREARGLPLPHAANELHVDQRVLMALENDDYEQLGAPIFVKGHLRNYAKLLGMDPAPLIAEYEAAQPAHDPQLVRERFAGEQMQDRQSHAFWRGLGWVLLIVGVLVLAGWWWYQQEGGADLLSPQRVESVRPFEVLEQDAAQTLPQERQPAAETDQPSMDEPMPEETATETEALPETERQEPATSSQQPEATTAAPATPAPQVAERAERQTRQPVVTAPPLVLEFSAESWVEVYDQEGRPILYDLVSAGTRREINATGRLRVFLGNADAVVIHVRGERFAHERYRRADSTARFNITVPAR